MNILIVDDEPRHLRGMAAMLRAMRPDASIATAKDGEAALAAVRDARPDVVLTDIQMPNMDGLTFLRRLEEEGIPAKVVMVSAYDLFAYAQTALRHGAYDYLLKPVDAEKVEALLERLERQLAAEREARASSDALRQRLREASPAHRSRQLHRWLAGELPPDEGAGLAEWPTLRVANVLVLTEAAPGDGAEADGAAEPAPRPPLEALAERLALAASAFGDACAFALQTEPAPGGARLVTALRLTRPTPGAQGR
ncbi:response regulator, partial [Paenibacillus sp. GCM10023250]|uniref:response regulator n=1 Tax=Paenibacillus sp. GCM10023250 TaxID=3252648 RepID=UPI00360624FB